MKKIVSLLICAVIAASVCVTAFAEPAGPSLCEGRTSYYDIMNDVLNRPSDFTRVDSISSADKTLLASEFALADVTGDGSDELLINFTGTDMASQIMYITSIYGGRTIFRGTIGSYTDFYTNGTACSRAYHNHSTGMSVWPYTLLAYNTYAGEFVPVGNISSIDREIVGAENFPSEYDEDGDGTVYCFLSSDPGAEKLYTDYAEFAEFEAHYFSEDQKVNIKWYPISRDNVNFVLGGKTSDVRGDADGDGIVKASDARFALRASAKLETLPAQAFKNCDLNGDGKITASEARKILRFSAKLEKTL